MLNITYSNEIKVTMKSFYESLSEKDRRRYAAIEALKLGHGGQKYICEILGCDTDTVKLGSEELAKGTTLQGRIRKAGGGRKSLINSVENIDEIFFEIVKDNTAGSPMDEEIKWTNLTMVDISKAFISRGLNISEHVVKQLLEKHKFVERKMQKTVAMKDAEERNEQFEKIHDLREQYENSNNPIISIDVKKRNDR